MRESVMWASEGGPIIGQIKHGKKYPFGTVPAEQYESDMDQVNERVTGLNTAVTACQGNIAGITTALDTLSGQYGATVPGLVQSLSDIRVQITEVSAAITAVTMTQNTDRTYFTERITAAENSVTALAQTVENYKATLSNQIEGLRADMTLTSQDIAVINNTLQSMGSTISGIQSAIHEVEGRMSTQEVGMSTLRQQLLNSVYTIENEIEQIVADKAAIKNSLNELESALNDYEVATNATLQEHNFRIARLEGGNPAKIISFTASPDICEMGGFENVILNWEVDGNINSVAINGETVTGTSKTYPDVHEDTAYTLSVVDAKGNTLNSTVSVDFVNHIYWGVSDSPNQTKATVKALNSTELSDNRTRIVSVSPNAEYVYYAYPKRLGTSEFIVNGFKGGFEDPVTVSIDNHSGYEEDYYVYRSTNKLNITLDILVI